MKNDPAVSKLEEENFMKSEKLAEEGIVLLENRDTLPFSPKVKTIALYGMGARRTCIGGTGSGAVNVRRFVSIEEGLVNSGYTIVTKDMADKAEIAIASAENEYNTMVQNVTREKGPLAGLMWKMGNPFASPHSCALTDEEIKPADACIYVVSRISGEGADRHDVPGDYRLTDEENSDIRLLSRKYKKFVLLLNVGGAVDISEIRHLPGAILFVSQAGVGAGEAAAAVISGKTSPSGHLIATWCGAYANWYYTEEMNSPSDVRYKEGSFVGYRWFDAFGKNVMYPFGYGLTYTQFSADVTSVCRDNENIKICLNVENTGTMPGKYVAQAYCGNPRRLTAFAKTSCMFPGENETAEMSFSLRQIADYNEETSSWQIEAGAYPIYIGENSRALQKCGEIHVQENIICEKCRRLFASEYVDSSAAASSCADVVSQSRTVLVPDKIFCIEADSSIIPVIVHTYGKHMGTEATSGLTEMELCKLCIGDSRASMGDFSVIGNASFSLPGAAGETTRALINKGIPSITMADGPAGIRVNTVTYEKDGKFIKNPAEDPIFSTILPPEMQQADLTGAVKKYHWCTALPVASMLAQSWNMDVLEEAGSIVASEMEETNVSLWLAPGMNIMRNPLCGRNFEYFSEDPLLTGLCAAAITNGVQKHPGLGVCIKHVACNNREMNRNFTSSNVSEKAMREIYLQGYAICIAKSSPVSAMSSYGLINGTQASNTPDLLTAFLRDECGFDGAVMTDWGATAGLGNASEQKYPCSSPAGCIAAGNDLIMPGSQRDEDAIMKALHDGTITLDMLKECASHVLRMLERLKKGDEKNEQAKESPEP